MWAEISAKTSGGSKNDWTEISIKYLIESAIEHNELRTVVVSIFQNPIRNIKEESCGNSSGRYQLQRANSLDY